MRRRGLRTSLLLLSGTIALSAAKVTDAGLERSFANTVRPFLVTYCISCHSGASPAAQFDLRPYSSMAAVIRDHPHWALVLEKLASKEMPPKQLKQPDPVVRQQVIDWIGAVRTNEARKHAGDPGLVLARRLSNAEYNYTIRDLTGVDIRPTREFPVDPANPAGFDNSGESLSMSPSCSASTWKLPAKWVITWCLSQRDSTLRLIRCWSKRTGKSMPSSALWISMNGNPPTMPATSRQLGVSSIGQSSENHERP
ncbi:MAG: DUF1587 domain-containing protein [Bryobacteraceae bacterium]